MMIKDNRFYRAMLC